MSVQCFDKVIVERVTRLDVSLIRHHVPLVDDSSNAVSDVQCQLDSSHSLVDDASLLDGHFKIRLPVAPLVELIRRLRTIRERVYFEHL